MSEDWKPGDLALCVRSGLRTREGVIYTVSHVLAPGAKDEFGKNGCSYPLLDFVELGRSQNASGASAFRKVRPDQHEPCEEEFTELLTRIKVKAGADLLAAQVYQLGTPCLGAARKGRQL